jgi:hypothetical protein
MKYFLRVTPDCKSDSLEAAEILPSVPYFFQCFSILSQLGMGLIFQTCPPVLNILRSVNHFIH